ncbi:MAG: gnd 2 [Bacteroidota bacterium]|nr:gnd 2 [Bacteroidota bacterium]
MEAQYDYGMIGIGTMGRNLVYNMCDHGFAVAGFDKDTKQVEVFVKEADKRKVFGTSNVNDFIQALKSPRVVMLLVPAGAIVDSVIQELKPLLSEQDIIVDCGNSHFTDTDRRIAELSKENLHFMGIGISGGEEGARYGPSIMPGGAKEIYARVAPVLEAISAKVNGEPCVTYLGPGSSGHYVKMVHNGIEYGVMQLISEAYHLLKEGAGLNNAELHQVFCKFNEGPLQSFLIEITANIFSRKDDLTANHLIDVIADKAQQKGTGKWTSQSAMDLGTPIPLIDAAVTMRELSALKEEREAAELKLTGPAQNFKMIKDEMILELEQALYFSMIAVYAQGMALLQQASKEFEYNLISADVASIWRGGCIIRATMLENIRSAYMRQPSLQNIMVDDFFAKQLNKTQSSARKIVQTGVENGIPVATMMSAIAYYDSYRHGWLPANLIQAQRDYFGAHTYQRTDRKGIFHTHWDQKQA